MMKEGFSMATKEKKKEAHVRFSPKEYAQVQVLARATDKSISEYLRSSALHENPVHITDGKEVAKELGRIHSKIILYQNAMSVRMDELRDSVQAYVTLLEDFRQGLPSSPAVQDTAKLLNMRVEAAVNVIKRAYDEYEYRTEEKLQDLRQEIRRSE